MSRLELGYYRNKCLSDLMILQEKMFVPMKLQTKKLDLEAEFRFLQKIIINNPFGKLSFSKGYRVDFLKRITKLIHLMIRGRISVNVLNDRLRKIRNDIEASFKENIMILDIIDGEKN
jgi:hypothetical protein